MPPAPDDLDQQAATSHQLALSRDRLLKIAGHLTAAAARNDIDGICILSGTLNVVVKHHYELLNIEFTHDSRTT